MNTDVRTTPAVIDNGGLTTPQTTFPPNVEQDRWQLIQSEFVDHPKNAVAEAHRLANELLERIISSFNSRQQALHEQWSNSHELSTEELRVTLQNYRALVSWLLQALPHVQMPPNQEHSRVGQ